MSSVTNVNTFLGSNPLGSKVRALERDVAELKKVVEELRTKGAGAGPSSSPAVSTSNEEVAALRKVVEELKAAGGVVGPAGPAGPAGPTGPAGPAGPTGPAGPMTYIAMPPGALPSVPVSAPPSS